MDELVDELCEVIDVKNFRVENFPSLIFLCGGSIVQHDAEALPSVRHFVFHHIKKSDPKLYQKIILAEEVNFWIDDSPYNNLLELEKDMAGLVSAIPIFLESTGSFAELGAFVSEKEIREKVLLFMEAKYYDQRSFVFLGPIKKLMKEEGEERVLSYPWESTDGLYDKKKLDDCVDDICADIKAFFQSGNKSEKFDPDVVAHKILLMADFIDVSFICRRVEISRFFEKCGITLEEKELSKYLDLAKNLKIIAMRPDGNEKFYFRINDNPDDFIAKYPQKDSKLKWKSKFREHISKKERKRLRAYQNWIEDNGGQT